MINDIKKAINQLVGHKTSIYVDVGRNKGEKYTGKIINAYNYIWTFETGKELKSFSYSDILSKIVIIDSLKW